MKTIVIGCFLVLAFSFCFAGDWIEVKRGAVTGIVGQSFHGPWAVFYRDMSGDMKPDRVELRRWCIERGLSLPVMVFLDDDLDGLCDGMYVCDLEMTVAEVWESEILTLYRRLTEGVGQSMDDVRPLIAKVEPMGPGC